MTLNDLKTGMIVTWRNGVELVVFRDSCTSMYNTKDCMVNYNKRLWNPLEYYDDNFKNTHGNTGFDIVKIETADHPYSLFDFNYERTSRKVIWKEQATKKLTVAEIEKILGYKVEIVSEEE